VFILIGCRINFFRVFDQGVSQDNILVVLFPWLKINFYF